MSVDHSFEIGRDESSVVTLNIAGLDSDVRSVDDMEATIYAYDVQTGRSKFTCRISVENLSRLYRHLGSYSVIVDSQVIRTGRFIEVDNGATELTGLLARFDSSRLIPALRHLVAESLSEADINTILGRRDSLQRFEEMLGESQGFSELQWQDFFERNGWIFGYGLRYKYLSILQREARLSKGDLGGGDVPITDFLLSDSRFTRLVELKRPSTPLFEVRKNRSRSWRLSRDLTDSVSQILAQKASWEMQAGQANYDSQGNRVREQIADVDCILIIGSRSQIDGTEKEVEIKLRTLELFRRNLRNLEVLLYDELLERARFIVDGTDDINDA